MTAVDWLRDHWPLIRRDWRAYRGGKFGRWFRWAPALVVALACVAGLHLALFAGDARPALAVGLCGAWLVGVVAACVIAGSIARDLAPDAWANPHPMGLAGGRWIACKLVAAGLISAEQVMILLPVLAWLVAMNGWSWAYFGACAAVILSGHAMIIAWGVKAGTNGSPGEAPVWPFVKAFFLLVLPPMGVFSSASGTPPPPGKGDPALLLAPLGWLLGWVSPTGPLLADFGLIGPDLPLWWCVGLVVFVQVALAARSLVKARRRLDEITSVVAEGEANPDDDPARRAKADPRPPVGDDPIGWADQHLPMPRENPPIAVGPPRRKRLSPRQVDFLGFTCLMVMLGFLVWLVVAGGLFAFVIVSELADYHGIPVTLSFGYVLIPIGVFGSLIYVSGYHETMQRLLRRDVASKGLPILLLTSLDVGDFVGGRRDRLRPTLWRGVRFLAGIGAVSVLLGGMHPVGVMLAVAALAIAARLLDASVPMSLLQEPLPRGGPGAVTWSTWWRAILVSLACFGLIGFGCLPEPIFSRAVAALPMPVALLIGTTPALLAWEMFRLVRRLERRIPAQFDLWADWARQR